MPTAAARSAASRITLTRALVALGVVLVGINVASAIWDVRSDRDRTELRARRDLSNLSALLSEQTAAALEAVDLVLRDAVRDGTTAKVAAMTPRLRDEMVHIPQVAGFLVLDADGRVVGRTSETPAIDHGFTGRAFFTAHREARDAGLFFGEPYQGGGDGTKWRFVMSRRLNAPGGAFSGVIAAVMEIENFDRLYRTIDVGEGGFINLRTRDGTVITRVPDPREARGRKFPNPDMSAVVEREGRMIGWTTSPILNARVLLSAVTVRGFPLEVLVGATEGAVFAPWHSEASRIFLRTVLTSAAMLALIALAAWGLARRERALQRKQRQFRAMIEHSSDGVILTRPETGIFYASPGLERMLGYTEMLVEQTDAGSPFKRYAQNVLTAANRARGLVDQILAYSRSQRGKRVAVDLSRIVAETLELVRGSLDPEISLEAKLPATPVQVFGDATQLHQVVMNLCTNAIQAMGGKGTLRVSLETAEVSAERPLAHGAVVPGTYGRLTVEDTGAGMDEATLGRIFEPFFTTKEVGKGTGLGLALVYGIITDAGGAIDVASAPGRGTAFTIYMPRVDVAVADDDEKQGPVARGHGERVLVVDDEQPLLAVTAEVLSRLGYEPVAFSESLAALAEFEAQPGRFDAAITDEVMPGLSGTELASVIHRRRPELPILLVSGYIGPMMSERATAAGVNEVLKKPVQSREIAAALARVLATR